MQRYKQILVISFFILLIGCGNEETGKKELDYEATKKIVIDILQTEDGKKAIQEAILDEEMKQELVIQSDVVKDAINTSLSSERGTKMWTHLFEDPTFVEKFVKSTEESQKNLLKTLMVDADFQKKMLDLLQNPEIMNQTLTVVKSQQFRKHLEEIIQDNLSSPLFLAKIEETLLKAAEETEKEEKKDEQEDKGEEEEVEEEDEEQEESEGETT